MNVLAEATGTKSIHYQMKLKLILLLALFVVTALGVSGQDIITTNDDTSFAAKVIEITPDAVKYKKFNNLEGPLYTIPVKDIKVITYENGTKEVFNKTATPKAETTVPQSQVTPAATPSPAISNYQNKVTNQNQSDARLLAMTYSTINPDKLEKRAKILKYVGAIGGGIFVGVGIYFLSNAGDVGEGENNIYGASFCGVGALWFGGFYLLAHNLNKKAREIRRATLVENTIFQSGKHRLNAGIDLLSDRSQHALGIGLSFTF